MRTPKMQFLVLVILSAATLFLISGCIPSANALAPAGASPSTGAILTRQSQAAGDTPGITVLGQGSTSVSPDSAEIWLGVASRALTVAEAQSDASARMSQVMDRLTALGISKDQIATVRYNVFPQYSQNQDISGYEVNNIISVKTRGTDGVGALLDAVVAAGANRVERVSFTVADPKPLTSRAREAAMADARDKATQLARLAGVALGPVTSIVESVSGGTPLPLGMGGDTFAASAPPITPGEMQIQVNVQVTYGIQ